MSPNPVYRELQQHLDKLPIGFPAVPSGVEIEILQYFFTTGEAKLALCLTLKNSSVSVIIKRYKLKYQETLSSDKTSIVLNDMFMKGVINRGGKNGRFSYQNAMLVIGMFEFNVDHLKKELLVKLQRYLDEGFGEEFFKASLPQLRTSPHLKAVIPEHEIDTYDNIKNFVRTTKKSIQVANCVCKQGEEILGNPCKQVDNIEICLMIGGENFMARDQAREISKDECLDILDMAEDKGLVLQPGNTREPFCICLCCGCCCGVITTAKKFPDPARFFATNYFVEIKEEDCVGCGICIKRCQIEALTLHADIKKVSVDLNRCIGCGLCVTKCPTRAAVLVKKEKETVPPLNIALLYLSILKGKVGKKKMIINMLKMLTGGQL
ncbi:MAG: 4Fe-4S binding protein [Spirochaetales bacterium]|nr:4Fe-4S binding protein [Spirochaetales bacterium]